MSELTFTGLGIHIKVKDIVASRAFYESLGFAPVFGYGDDAYRATLPEGCPSAPERYRGVTYHLAEGMDLELGDGHIAVKPEVFGEPITSPKVSAMVKVASIVPILENQAIKVTHPVRHYYWGSIELVLKDPDGFVLVFIAPYSDQEFAAVSKLTAVQKIEPGGTV